jgi:hypothetical protein
MKIRTLLMSSMVLAALVLAADRAWGLGLILGQTKDELKLKYDVTVYDPDNGQVAIHFTLVDEGRLKPLDGVELMIPKEDGSGYYDLTAPLALRESDGKRVARINMRKEWASRAEIWLTTYWFDGKHRAHERNHYVIPIAKHMKEAATERKKG